MRRSLSVRTLVGNRGVRVRRSVVLGAAAVALLLPLGGCTSRTPGVAGSSPTTGATTGGSDSGPFSQNNPPPSTSASTSGVPSPTASIEPCSLLTSSDLSTLHLTTGTDDKLGYGRGCKYRYTNSNTYLFGIAIYDTLGVRDIQGRSDPKQIRVGNHDAVQAVTGGECVIAIKVTDTSRVEASTVVTGDVQEACSLARPAADIIEKKLP
jgi:Protein of unknown function (DUF3558)